MSLLKKLFGKKTPFEGHLIEVNDNHWADRIIDLATYAIDNNVAILVGSQYMIDKYKQWDSNIEVYGFAENFTKHLKDIELSVLMDESVKSDMVEILKLEFPNIKIVGGYKRSEE